MSVFEDTKKNIPMITFEDYYKHRMMSTKFEIYAPFYVIMPREDVANFHRSVKDFDTFVEWADNCSPPLVCFEGVVSDDIAMPKNYDYLILPNSKRRHYFIFKKYYEKDNH